VIVTTRITAVRTIAVPTAIRILPFASMRRNLSRLSVRIAVAVPAKIRPGK
jgi:hypothetical protein